MSDKLHWIDQLCQARGITRYRLSKLTNISDGLINNWCVRKSLIETISSQSLEKLSTGLGMSMEDLYKSVKNQEF